MINAGAKEFIQGAAEYMIQCAQGFAAVSERAKFASTLVEKLGDIGDVYWSSGNSVEVKPEVKPTDRPVFALFIEDRKQWTRLSVRVLRRGFNGQVHGWAYELDLTNEFAIEQFLFAVNASFPQFAKSIEARR